MLSNEEVTLLEKGLNFAVTPREIPTHDYIIGIESACKLIGAHSTDAQRLRSDCVRVLKNADPPKSNISVKERDALRSLARDKEITILPADKGRSVVVLNMSDYVDKANVLLSDTKTYKVLPRDPTGKYTTTIVEKLQELKNKGSITDLEYKRLYPTTTMVPRLYMAYPRYIKLGPP